ncbi:MAG: hypothetical protein AB1756_01155 [Acidobacteriota bacterium]
MTPSSPLFSIDPENNGVAIDDLLYVSYISPLSMIQRDRAGAQDHKSDDE